MLPTTFRSIWPSCFRVEDFQKSTNQKQELPVAPCLLMDRDKMSNLYREPSIDASYQSLDSFGKAVSEHKDFQKSTNQKQELPMAAIFVNGSGRNEQSLQRTSHRCILPSFGSFGKAVLEEKIFQKSTNQKQELSVAAMFVNGSGRNEQSF